MLSLNVASSTTSEISFEMPLSSIIMPLSLSRKSINLYAKAKESELMNPGFNEHRQSAVQEGLKTQQKTFYCGGKWELVNRSTK